MLLCVMREKFALSVNPSWLKKIEPFEYVSDGSPLGDESKRIVDEIVRTSRVKVVQAPIDNPQISGIYDANHDRIIISNHPKGWARHPAIIPHVLAHEDGHDRIEKGHPVLRHAQSLIGQLGNPNGSPFPSALAVLGGAFAPSRMSRAASVLGGTLWNGVPLLAERKADDYARARVLDVAHKKFHEPYGMMSDLISAENQSTYHKGMMRTGLLGLLGMGARELYDHRQQILDTI